MYKVIAWSLITRNNEEEILLVKKIGDDEWTPVGGHIEDNESSVMTVARRANEELNIKISDKDLNFLCVIDRKLDDAYKFHVFFKTSKWEGNIENLESDIHSKVKWFNLNDLPIDLGPLATMAVESLQNNQLYHFKDYTNEDKI